MARLFGTDGIRGEAGCFPLDAATVHKVGSSLAAYLRDKLKNRAPLIVTGRDTRESGPWLEQTLSRGATEAGAICRSAGVITTPGVAFLARTLPADAGIVISASHNPYQDNGIKIFASSGQKLEDATERLIEADIVAAPGNQQPNGSVSAPAPVEEDRASSLSARYLNFLAAEIGASLSLKGLKIVIDCANGAASTLGPALLRRLGAHVISINDRPDGRNINLNSGSLHIEGLQERVQMEHTDLGVAFDGDADRSLFVDAHGGFVDGDATLWVIAKYLQTHGTLKNDLVVATVMSNIGLEIALRSRGLQLVRTNVGDKYVLEELLRSGASLGGEQSGHVIFPSLSLAGDGLITTLCLLRAMLEEGKGLHELTEGFVRYPQVLVNVKVAEKQPFDEVESIQAVVRETEKELGEKGRLLLRYSGTEALARVMIEGQNQSQIERQAERLAAAIQTALGQPSIVPEGEISTP
jgi:phosphoglucosamine mutase